MDGFRLEKSGLTILKLHPLLRSTTTKKVVRNLKENPRREAEKLSSDEILLFFPFVKVYRSIWCFKFFSSKFQVSPLIFPSLRCLSFGLFIVSQYKV